MKAAIVTQAGRAPVYADFPEPTPVGGEHRVAVTAAALSTVVKSRAAGSHYSAEGSFPFVVGIDGVGNLDDGRRIYFLLPRAPYGSMAETTVVSAAHCVAVPDGLTDIGAAALANPGLSSWAAFKERVHLKPGETVLINGATGTSGRLAVGVARYLGARKVIATGRNVAVLKSVGADAVIPLTEDLDALEAAFKQQFRAGVDVVLDYLWGKSAERLLAAATKTAQEGVPIRFVQLGHSSGANITLPATILRSAAVELTGSGLGSVALPRILKAVEELFDAAVEAGFTVETRAVPLSQVEQAWQNDRLIPRVVFTTGRN
jgi:NADPH:quinone reductase-like Zn-dependent oxidoreductase